jgi:hypothetical protein
LQFLAGEKPDVGVRKLETGTIGLNRNSRGSGCRAAIPDTSDLAGGRTSGAATGGTGFAGGPGATAGGASDGGSGIMNTVRSEFSGSGRAVVTDGSDRAGSAGSFAAVADSGAAVTDGPGFVGGTDVISSAATSNGPSAGRYFCCGAGWA